MTRHIYSIRSSLGRSARQVQAALVHALELCGLADITITEHAGVNRDDWSRKNMSPCPECGSCNFSQIYPAESTIHLPQSGGTPTYSDTGYAGEPMEITCSECEAVLYQHPSGDLYYDQPPN